MPLTYDELTKYSNKLEEENNNLMKALKTYEEGRYQEHLEIERLKELSKTDYEASQEILFEKNEEIERLNNIINELEKSLKELIRYSLECYEKYEVNWEERKCVSNTWLTGRDNYLSILNYLQRLKGNDKGYFYTTSKEVEEDLQELKGSDKK